QARRLSGLWRGDRGKGENGARPIGNAGSIEQFRPPCGECANQLFNGDARHAIGRSTAGRHFRTGSSNCGNTNCVAEGARSPGRWPHPAVTRRSGALFFRRREFYFLRRQTSHCEESGGRCGCCSPARTRSADSKRDGLLAAVLSSLKAKIWIDISKAFCDEPFRA